MGINDHKVFFGKVRHGRLFPKRNNFSYSIYYIVISLAQLKSLPIAHNKKAVMNFYDRDHGACDGSDIEKWARDILLDYNITKANGDIKLVCMPRIFGYVFNPVSFWICQDKESNTRAVLCEVNNTFGERHTYLCAHDDQRVINSKDTLKAQKLFHVSPMLKREGHYIFRFDFQKEKMNFFIDYYDENNQKQLVTSLLGRNKLMNKKTLRIAFFTHPLVTFKAITLIHWQAFKLLIKGIKYIPRPDQTTEKLSATTNLKKM